MVARSGGGGGGSGVYVLLGREPRPLKNELTVEMPWSSAFTR